MLALERGNIEMMRSGQGAAAAIGNSTEIREWARQHNLLSDQTAVAERTLASSDWITSIEGRAGAAKTTTVGAIREFAVTQGYAVYGFAPTTRAVKSLSEAGVSASTVASLLERQSARDASSEVWIIDESSLLPTRQVNRLLRKAREQSVERIVLVGDQGQHHAIEAGRPVYQMQEAGMLVARLDTIRRQRDPELREAVMLAARGEVAESLAILDRRGDIREVADIEQRRKQIAREYVAAHESGQRVLVVSPANDERRELNKAIRSELIVRGHISLVGKEHTILVNRGLSGAQRATAYNYEEGDVIRFTRGSKQFAITKGDYARVEAVDREANLLTVRVPDGRHAEYNPVRLFGVEVFREEERTIARGERIQFRAPDKTLGLANGEFANIDSIDDRRAVLRLDNGSQLSAAVDRLRHIDHGYASTSHSAQGATVDHVIVNIDTALSLELVNRKQFYVSISRARHGVTVYTDDRQLARHAVGRSREKSLALERSTTFLERGFKIVPEHSTSPRHQHNAIRR
jgi:ATP-dependent exoDNAse (exonuclease V) alpha subunit